LGGRDRNIKLQGQVQAKKLRKMISQEQVGMVLVAHASHHSYSGVSQLEASPGK
jgi:hypothetical protein